MKGIIKKKLIKNLATGAQHNKKASQFLLNVIPIGKSVYAQFRKGKLEERSVQLLDSIPKTRIPTVLSTKKKKNEILKETTAFMQNTNYFRLHDHSIASILKYEIISASFYLTKDCFLCKHKKSELATVVK